MKIFIVVHRQGSVIAGAHAFESQADAEAHSVRLRASEGGVVYGFVTTLRKARKRPVHTLRTLQCAVCGQTTQKRHPTALYCSAACRQRAKRKRGSAA